MELQLGGPVHTMKLPVLAEILHLEEKTPLHLDALQARMAAEPLE